MARTNIRVPMPVKRRAKQFMMFDAMKGLTEAIAEKERQFTPKVELADDRKEELNQCLMELHPGVEVSLEYYCQYESRYKKISGQVKKVDLYWETIQIGESTIGLSEISDIMLI